MLFTLRSLSLIRRNVTEMPASDMVWQITFNSNENIDNRVTESRLTSRAHFAINI